MALWPPFSFMIIRSASSALFTTQSSRVFSTFRSSPGLSSLSSCRVALVASSFLLLPLCLALDEIFSVVSHSSINVAEPTSATMLCNSRYTCSFLLSRQSFPSHLYRLLDTFSWRSSFILISRLRELSRRAIVVWCSTHLNGCCSHRSSPILLSRQHVKYQFNELFW